MSDAKELLLKQKLETEELAAFRAEHQKAFRIAFDLLTKRCFPPMRSAEYFQLVSNLISKTEMENRESRLVPFLLSAVMQYLDSLSHDLPIEEDET